MSLSNCLRGVWVYNPWSLHFCLILHSTLSFVSDYNSLVFCLEIVDSRMMSFVHVRDFTWEIGSPDFSLLCLELMPRHDPDL